MPKTTIVTAIPYVNSTPHIGNILTTLSGDVTARYLRMRGEDVFSVAGTDENGLKIKEAAESQGRDAHEFTAEIAQRFIEIFDGMNMKFDKQSSNQMAQSVGKNMNTEQGKLAARAVAIDLLGTLHAALAVNSKDLGHVKRIVKLMSLVNSTGDFTEQHLVTNGASELIGELFGSAGAHARSAFGVAQIPFGACVEIEMIAEVS
jgi:enamine deaminase RidA (YjgF/YER057c/UK114 family)